MGTITPPEGELFFVRTVDFGRDIGVSACVETSQSDEILFAQREGRQGLTRFVKNKNPDPTSLLTFGLKKDEMSDRNEYLCIFAFFGPKAEPEPWDKNATEAARSFWKDHALVWGFNPIIPGTETNTPPPEYR